MDELLTLCGFSTDEIPAQRPRLRQVCRKFGINDEDVRTANRRLIKYYAVSLEGVRKVLRLCLLEFLDSILAREEGKSKILSGFMAPGFDIIGAAAVNASDQVFSAHQSWALLVVIGCIFGKLAPVLEAAEKKWLKAGMVAHCGNVKTLLGTIALDLIPKPDLLVTAGFLCETAPKTLDLLHEVYDMPVACYDTCLDRPSRDYSRATRRTIDLAAKSLRAVTNRIVEVVGFDITDAMLLAELQAKTRLIDIFGKISRLMVDSDPIPLSATHNTLWMCLNALTLNRQRLSEAVAALDVLYDELLERIDQGIGPVKKGAPRILAMLPGQHADPRLEHLAEEVGIAIVTGDPDLSTASSASGTSNEGTRDPYILMCQGLTQSLITSLPERIPLIVDACKQYGVNGVLDRYHVGCRSVAGDAFLLEAAIKKELGIPVLLLEWENFDPRVFDRPEYRKRLEVFKAMMEDPIGKLA